MRGGQARARAREVREAERLGDQRAHELAEVLARGPLGDLGGDDVVAVAVGEAPAGRALRAEPRDRREDLGARPRVVGRAALDLGPLRVARVVAQARAVREQQPRRELAGVGEGGQPAGDGSVEVERALLGEPEEDARGDELAARGEHEAVVRRGARGRRPEELPAAADGDLGRWNMRARERAGVTASRRSAAGHGGAGSPPPAPRGAAAAAPAASAATRRTGAAAAQRGSLSSWRRSRRSPRTSGTPTQIAAVTPK